MESEVQADCHDPLEADTASRRTTGGGPLPVSVQAVREGPADLSVRPGASSEALRDLALALRTSVEAMHGVRDLQAELVKSLGRQDRSELVLQSTQALNDTFRNLTSIQRELLTRIEGGTKRGSRILPLLLLGLLVVFLGGVYVVLDVFDQMRAERREDVLRAMQVSQGRLETYREGMAEGAQEAQRALEDLQGRLAQVNEREEALRLRLDREVDSRADLQGQVRAMEAERDSLASQIRAAEAQVLARRAVEDELAVVSGRLAVTEPRVRQLESALEQERAESTDLRHRLAALGLGRPDPEGSPPDASSPPPDVASVPRPPDASEISEASTTPRGSITRDALLLEKIRDRVNQMLDTSSRSRDDLWQVTRIDGVSVNGLHGVIALRYDRRSGRLLEQVQARELEIWVDRGRRRVDLEFQEGLSSQGRGSAAFADGVKREAVADGEMTRLWSQSGMGFLRYR